MIFRNLLVATSITVVFGVSSLGAETGQGKGTGNQAPAADKESRKANQSKSSQDSTKTSDDATAGESFSVVQIDNTAKVVKTSEVAALRDKVNEDYKKALRAYEDARKAATKAKKKLGETKPSKPVFKTLYTALKSQDDANAKCDKEVQRIEVKKKKAKEAASNR